MLHAEGAKVGAEVRVVGNDAGEKLSILPGVLSRLIAIRQTNAAILDSSVDRRVLLLVQQGDKDMEATAGVQELHATTPDRFVTVAGASLHNLSYQQARLYGIACKGLYVCEAEGSFKMGKALSGWIIDTVDHRSTPDLDSFAEVMKTVPDKSRVVVSYRHIRDLYVRETGIVHINRHWHPKMRVAIRNDEPSLWDFKDLGRPLPARPCVPKIADSVRLDGLSEPAPADIVRSFVKLDCYMPETIDGFPQARGTGFGWVVDAEQGLVVVSRATVPCDLCDITVTVADSIEVDGKVILLHPLTNYTVVSYDPSLVHVPVQTAKLSDETIKQGAETIFVGFNQHQTVVVAKTMVTNIAAVGIAPNAAPRYRAINLDAITVDTALSSQCSSGVLIGADGVVQALWLTYMGPRIPGSHRDTEYHFGLATTMIKPVIDQIPQGIIPDLKATKQRILCSAGWHAAETWASPKCTSPKSPKRTRLDTNCLS